MRKRKGRWHEFFLWNWRNFVISAIVFVLIFFYRNRTIKILFEPIGLYPFIYYFFLIGILLYWAISVIYTLINYKKIKKRKKMKNKFDKFLLMNWRKAGLILLVWIVAVVIHNLGSALMSIILNREFEEAVFFIIANLFIPIYFLISIIYTLIKKMKKRK